MIEVKAAQVWLDMGGMLRMKIDMVLDKKTIDGHVIYKIKHRWQATGFNHYRPDPVYTLLAIPFEKEIAQWASSTYSEELAIETQLCWQNALISMKNRARLNLLYDPPRN